MWFKNIKGRGEVFFIEVFILGLGCKYCCIGGGVMRGFLMIYLFRNNVKSYDL